MLEIIALTIYSTTLWVGKGKLEAMTYKQKNMVYSKA